MYSPQNHRAHYRQHNTRGGQHFNRQYGEWRGQPTVFDRLAQSRREEYNAKLKARAKAHPRPYSMARNTATLDDAAAAIAATEGYTTTTGVHPTDTTTNYHGLDYAGRVAAALALTIALAAQGCYAPPKLTKRGMTKEEFDKLPLGKKLLSTMVNYGTIDEQLGAAVKELSPGRAAQAVVFYPVDWAIDMGIRTPKSMLYDLPRATWREINPNDAGTRTEKIVRVLFMPITGPVVYIGKLGEGAVRQAVEAPLETVVHSVVTGVVIQSALGHDRASAKSKKTRSGGNPPPTPPPEPPPVPPPEPAPPPAPF